MIDLVLRPGCLARLFPIFCPRVHQKKPGGKARLLTSKSLLALELVVQAQSTNSCSRLGAEAKSTSTSVRRSGSCAEIYIKGFKLDGKVISQSMLDTATKGPARLRT
jgi:hypothetical protein